MKQIEIPSTLNIEEIFNLHQPPEGIKRDRLLYLIHLIYYAVVTNPDNVVKGWTNLDSQLLKKTIGNNYAKYIKYLMDSGVIERSYYIVGSKSFGYKMSDVNHDLTHHRLIEVEDKTLIDNIKRQTEFSYVISTNVKKNRKYLKKWFNNDFTAEIPEGLPRYYKSKLININENRYRMSIDEFGKRLHTNLTNMPKELRQYLRYNGEPLVEIDIKNSQFYMAIKLLMQHIKSNHSEIFNILDTIADEGDKISFISQTEGLEDIAKFITDVTTGNFYESLMEDYQAKYNISLDRDDAKKLMLRVMYSKPNYNDSFKSVFRERYPVAAEIFNHKKRVNKLTEDKYKALAQSLQRIESGLMIRTICKNEALTDVPLFTIHDSILTTVDNAELVKRIMITELTNEIEFKPT